MRCPSFNNRCGCQGTTTPPPSPPAPPAPCHPYSDIVPYHDAHSNFRSTVRVCYDIQVTKLAGLERWRFIVPILRIAFLDGTPVRSDGMLKSFVRLKYSQQRSMFDARQAFISYSPVKASRVEVSAERVIREENGDVAVFFTSFTDTEPGKGMSKATVTATSNPIFVNSKVT